ncbi:hypothetical protein RVR_8333 [Actinacidiphila reveromycinica]|uniref:Uncharacterized protein n=1 Tax=Actinacidiphila reveromycinica TaxID=659352 RepID=A0A7U3UYD5_9ACTN|nr:hypothetical protein [Streptomyces sp. SN-593]BBB01082.1 hypothetical protein RVR_8333 [Streptomyces sp. SN-593]
MTSHAARRAARALATAGKRKAAAAPLVRGADWRTATVATVGTDGTITTTDGIPARRMASYSHPAAGDRVVISRSGSGNWRAEGLLVHSTDTEWTTYTPAVTGAGSATWSTRDGWWKRSGSLIFFTAYMTASAVGTGTSNVMFSLPSVPFRGSANRRQAIPCHVSNVGSCIGVVAAGGTLAAVDSITTSTGANIVGTGIAANTIITVTGMYREA